MSNANVRQAALLVSYVEPARANVRQSALVTSYVEPARANVRQAALVVSYAQLTRSAVVPDISGSPGVGAVFDGSASIAEYYTWTWTSLPAGSALFNYPQPLPDNAVGSLMADNEVLYHFSGNANDSSGNSNNLTLTSTTYEEGFDGSASSSLGFSGNSSKAIVGTDVDLSGGNWTIAFWFYNLKPNSAWRTGTRGSSVDHQIIIENGSNNLGVYANGNGDFRDSGFDMPSADYQGWHHIAAVGSGTTTSFYVNGSYVGASDRKSTDNIHSIGNWQGGGQLFAERIDEFAAWTRVLSASEIAEVHKVGSTGLGISTATASFTPDVAGTYTVQLTVADGVSTTANAVISAAVSGPDGISKIINISKDNIGSILGISYGDIDKINDID